MRHFTYLGDHASVTLWGIQFPCGVPVAVESAHALRKLAGNRHFAETLDGCEVVPASVSPATTLVERVDDPPQSEVEIPAPPDAAENAAPLEAAPRPRGRPRKLR